MKSINHTNYDNNSNDIVSNNSRKESHDGIDNVDDANTGVVSNNKSCCANNISKSNTCSSSVNFDNNNNKSQKINNIKEQLNHNHQFNHHNHHHHILQDFSIKHHTEVIIYESINLFSVLFHGTPKWIYKTIRLLLFVICLLPAFIVFAYYYFISSDRISVPYYTCSSNNNNNESSGDDNNKNEEEEEAEEKFSITCRHFLDIYGSSIPVQHTTTRCSNNRNRNNNVTNNNETNNSDNDDGKPVVIFITGGAWIIGYKMWGTLLARALVPFGVLVIIPDYRNYPQTNIIGMINDIDNAIQWSIDHCYEYGGNNKKIVIVGQSAGAHISTCLLLRKFIKNFYNINNYNNNVRQQLSSSDDTTTTTTTTTTTISSSSSTSSSSYTSSSSTSWSINDISGFIPVSGPYDLIQMQSILHKNGLDKNIVSSIFCNNLKYYSPTIIVKSIKEKKQLELLQQQQQQGQGHNNKNNNYYNYSYYFPPTCIMHGTIDKTVPYQISIEFYNELKYLFMYNSNNSNSNNNNNISMKLYHNWSHTDPILEAPFIGDHTFHKDIYNLVQYWTTSIIANTTTKEREEIKYDDDDDDDDCSTSTHSSNNNSDFSTNEEEKKDDEDIIAITNATRTRTTTTTTIRDDVYNNNNISNNNNINLLESLSLFDENHPSCKPICPLFLVKMARYFNPF